MNRRAFFASMAALAAGATLDPERLLWKPGKLISIPPPRWWGPEVRVHRAFCYDCGGKMRLTFNPVTYDQTIACGPCDWKLCDNQGPESLAEFLHEVEECWAPPVVSPSASGPSLHLTA